MKFEEQSKIDDDVFERVRAIRETKGKEYATEEDTLADFKEVAAEAGITPLQCWATYVKKHERAIDTFIREGNVKSEAIYDRIVDVVVYHLLLIGLIEDLENPEPQVPMAHRGPAVSQCGSAFKPDPNNPDATVYCNAPRDHDTPHTSRYMDQAVSW